MLYEAQYFCMQPHAVELNRLIDTILSTIFRVIASSSSPTTRCRRLVFSSFSPEVCAALACKQRTFPVLFLSDSNNWPTPDARALSLQAALRFAKRWRLAGVVLHCNPFVAAPRLVRLTADAGLVSSTYGAGNDDPVQAKVSVAVLACGPHLRLRGRHARCAACSGDYSLTSASAFHTVDSSGGRPGHNHCQPRSPNPGGT